MKLTRGRYKRMPIARIDSSYLQWLALHAYDLPAPLLAEVLSTLHHRHTQILARYGLGGHATELPAKELLAVQIRPHCPR
jgi:hypothetical protein